MFRINVSDATWRVTTRYVEAEIENIRNKLEVSSGQTPDDDAIRTATYRGQIKALRALLKDLPTKDFSQPAG